MAVKYAWYPHGDKIAIVEKKDTESDWTSPSENITNGINIEISSKPYIGKAPLTGTGDSEYDPDVDNTYVDKDSALDWEETDENDYIWLDDILVSAIVYYVKGKLAEDGGQIDLSQMFFKKFYNLVYKHNDNRLPGVRHIFPPKQAIR